MQIKPFRGWRYRPADGDVSGLIAPPYDVLTAADKDRLLEGDARNIVAVDLPHVPPKEAGPPEAYAAAAERLARWQREGVLVREESPALYAYEQTFELGGVRRTRRAMIAAVRLTALGEDVLPHEHTFAGPKADRLRLSEHARTQLSPIFGIFDEPAGRAAPALWSAAADPPDLTAEIDGRVERLWAVTDPEVIRTVTDALTDVQVFIADGHHRYTTALVYRDGLGDLPPDHPANFVMFVLTAADDPGLAIWPTHRLIAGLRGFDLAAFRKAGDDVFDFRDVEIAPEQAVDADAFLRPFGEHAIGLLSGDRACVATPQDLSVMAEVAPDQIDAWRQLDVSILHALLIDRCLAPWTTPETAVTYTADGPEAVAAAREGRADLACLLRATPMRAVEEIALAGAFMPHKSTYFYPKVATGMVMYPLTKE
jgi:uncharacterized protein (DUF1015 family)